MKKFFACQKGQTELFTKYETKVEELFTQAVEMGAMQALQEQILMSFIYQGLKQPLKQMANLKFETLKDYDLFNIEDRSL